MADQSQDMTCRLPSLPQLPSTGCSSCSSSSSTLTSQLRRQETAEIRRQWKQNKAKVHKLVLKPKLPAGGSTTLPSLNVAAASGHHRNLYVAPSQDRSPRLPQLTNTEHGSLPALHGYEVTKRPSYVLRISLPPVEACREKWRPAPSTKPTLTIRRDKTTTGKDSKYFFVSPEWDSERHTLEQFRESGQMDILKQGWM